VSSAPVLRPRGATTAATVTRVIDGDTIDVSLPGGIRRVRLIGVDAAEPNSPDPALRTVAAAATDALTELVDGRDVVLEADRSETDRYGRLLRYVWLESSGGLSNVNVALAEAGWVESKAYPPDTAWQVELDAAEAAARAAGRGRWAVQAAAAPPPGAEREARRQPCSPPPISGPIGLMSWK
jgi:micrococcal nuclease